MQEADGRTKKKELMLPEPIHEEPEIDVAMDDKKEVYKLPRQAV